MALALVPGGPFRRWRGISVTAVRLHRVTVLRIQRARMGLWWKAKARSDHAIAHCDMVESAEIERTAIECC